MKSILKQIAPYGLVKAYQNYNKRRMTASLVKNASTKRNEFHDRIDALYSSSNSSKIDLEINDQDYYKSLIDSLVKRGIPEDQVIAGSMPLKSLIEIDKAISENFSQKKIFALQIGNFVGVSLAFITRSVLKHADRDSLVLSIDPNLTHRGVTNPINFVNALLSENGLDSNSIVMCGYSLNKSVSNDGQLYGSSYDPFKEYQNEFAPQNVIDNLCKIRGNFLDIVIIDGNHEASYLQNEIDRILPLLHKDSIIVLDDINPKAWVELYSLYKTLDKSKFMPVKENNRIAILKYV